MTWKTITLAMVVAGAAAASIAVPRTAAALPPNIVSRVYYSDATFTVEVGWETVTTCQGVVHDLEGRRTLFIETYSDPCDLGPPPPPACTVHGVVVPCNFW